jgi:hypothetical protein
MKYLKVFVDFRKDMEPLTDEERGRLFTAMLMYAENGTESGLIGNERFLWGTAKKQIDAQSDSYKKLCDMNKRNRAKRDEPLPSVTDRDEPLRTDMKGDGSLQEQEQEQEQEQKILSKESKERSPHPSLEEIEEYVREAELTMDPRAFFDHFTSNGWKVGGKAPMKDWRAAARNWARRERPSTKNHTPSAYKNAELERLEVDLG